MLNSQMKTYSRVIRVDEDDEYNQKVPTYKVAGNVQMVISLITKEDYTQNNLKIKQASHTAITFDDVNVGDIIGDQYEVEYVNKVGRENLVYLKENEGNGIFS